LVLGYTPYRPMSTQTSRDRMTKKTRSEVEQGEETVERLQAQVEAVKREAQAAFESGKSKWAAAAHDIKELRVTPRRSDILVEVFGLGWLPYWEIIVDGVPVEISARL
jgi:hypothetical protein